MIIPYHRHRLREGGIELDLSLFNRARETDA